MNPVLAFEYLFFAVFGQTTHGELKVENNQPQWTSVLFKLTFGVYMLVSVVVLINLLIAMMSDTYQRIQAQSDIEWKYGLSKLIRNMHRTTTAPSPLNLLTTWSVYFIKLCKQRTGRRKRPSLVHMMGLQRAGRLSPRSKMGAKWLAKVKKGQVRPKDSVTLSVVHLSPLGSQLSFNSATRIENVVDWDSIRKKYLALTGNEPEKDESEKEEKGDEEAKEDAGPTASNATAIPATIPPMTTTAPSPLNLLTTWITYLCKHCKKRMKKKQRPSLMQLMGGTRLSPRSRMGAKWLAKVKKTQVAHKDNVGLSVVHLSPLGSQLSFRNATKIDNVVDWDVVRRKYRDLYGESVEKTVEENKESTETNPLAVLEGSSNVTQKSGLPGA